MKLHKFMVVIVKLILLSVTNIILYSNNDCLVSCKTFTVGYLTGSQRKPGDMEYDRPGLTISGAISLAFAEVNEKKLKPLGHNLEFIVAETYGEEVTSIRQTADLWIKNVSAYIGPQETCVYEGRMAAAFNLPMISYFCTHQDTSNKKNFPTFARTRPPDIQISKAVVSLLLEYNWTRITFIYFDSEDLQQYHTVATTLMITMEQAGIEVLNVRTWNEVFHVGYMENPFEELVEQTFATTRIYLILGQHFEHIGLLDSLHRRGLIERGDYFVVGIDIEQYDPKSPEKYLKGVLQNSQDDDIVNAFQSYLAVAPSSPVGFDAFSIEVNKYLEVHPFYYRNPLERFGGVKRIRAEAAYLYDAVHLYADALVTVLSENNDPNNGQVIFDAMRGRKYMSAMGYMVYIDENGDAAGNYTVMFRKKMLNQSQNHYGLFPVGTFIDSGNGFLPDCHFFDSIDWTNGEPPVAEPACGFHGEKCISYTGEITAGVSGVFLMIVLTISLVLYRNWKYEQELDSLLWKIDFKEIVVPEADKETTGQKLKRSNHPLIRTSQASLSSNPDADFRYSMIFTQVGLYRGQLYSIKKVKRKTIDITREMKMELKMLRDIRHDNLNAFIGACTDPPTICIITEYCTRGSLKDVLENDDVKLDNMFIASLVGDIMRGMNYLHDSPIKFHGNLCPANCLIDSRWVVKISDFGLHAFKTSIEDYAGELSEQNQAKDNRFTKLLYRAPEILRAGPIHLVPGSQKGDIYSFGIVLYEIFTRRGPFGEIDCPAFDCLKHVVDPVDSENPFRPSLQPLDTMFDCVKACVRECWTEKPDDRPDFKTIRTKLRPLRKGMKPNIFDNMMAMMEKYANNLEQLVDERTDQLQEEKKKTEALLLEMLPKPVAEQLKKGHKVEAEGYDCVTIYFSDIVGFTNMSAESTPLQVVDFLNDLYTCFDSIIGNYDVYKVETIGDAYMVVSGLPIRNGNVHAAEIASMALELLNAVAEFKIRHRPSEKLLLRIGIHSGPVCAGVVGLKMPRYCLFGDTVNTASRMESNGEPLKVHCSKSTKDLLSSLGGYNFNSRGIINVKGKGEQETFWLVGEDEDFRLMRNHQRKSRRGSRALSKHKIRPGDLVINQRSSLKHKSTNLKRPSIPRSTSLESPKKLRFASETLLEHHQYHRYSDDALVDVVTIDYNPNKTNGSIFCEDFVSSCPCIDSLCIETQRCVMTPLLIGNMHKY